MRFVGVLGRSFLRTHGRIMVMLLGGRLEYGNGGC